AVAPNVPNPLITLNLKDLPFKQALRTLIRLATPAVPNLTFSDEGGVYLIKIREQVAPPPEEQTPPEETGAGDEVEYHWEKVPVDYNSAVLMAITLGGNIIPTEDQLFGGQQGGGGGFGGGGYGGSGFGGGGFGGGLGGFGGGFGGGGLGGGGFGGGGLG